MEIVQAVKELHSISRARLNFRRWPILCTTLYRNLSQVSKFGGTFAQLFLWVFLCNFHRRCLSTSSIPWCKKVKNDQKLKSRGSCLNLLNSCRSMINNKFMLLEGGSGQYWVKQKVPIFVKTSCLWHKQLENEIILGGYRAPFLRKWVATLLFSTFLSIELNGKTVTCLPFGNNFDNFQDYKFCNFLSQGSFWTIERNKRKRSYVTWFVLAHQAILSHFHPCRPTFMQQPA